jgi:hypothetical protein
MLDSPEEVVKLTICRTMAAHRLGMDTGLGKILPTRMESRSRVRLSSQIARLPNINLPPMKASIGIRTDKYNMG